MTLIWLNKRLDFGFEEKNVVNLRDKVLFIVADVLGKGS